MTWRDEPDVNAIPRHPYKETDYGLCGDCDRVKNATQGAMYLHVSRPTRRARLEGCLMCDAIGDGMGPWHDASPNCESGGYTHCTCDTCF